VIYYRETVFGETLAMEVLYGLTYLTSFLEWVWLPPTYIDESH
jgi:hypothetical protein